MLDEALQVLSGLWSGEPFSFQGKHYWVQDARFLPTPQQARIPIWVGGFWPNQAPMRRAARYDGVFPLFNVWQDPQKLTAFKEAVAFVRAQQPVAQPFDILAVGSTQSNRDGEAVRAYQEAGATWWMEAVDPWSFGWPDSGPWPVKAMGQRVITGPPKIE